MRDLSWCSSTATTVSLDYYVLYVRWPIQWCSYYVFNVQLIKLPFRILPFIFSTKEYVGFCPSFMSSCSWSLIFQRWSPDTTWCFHSVLGKFFNSIIVAKNVWRRFIRVKAGSMEKSKRAGDFWAWSRICHFWRDQVRGFLFWLGWLGRDNVLGRGMFKVGGEDPGWKLSERGRGGTQTIYDHRFRSVGHFFLNLI